MTPHSGRRSGRYLAGLGVEVRTGERLAWLDAGPSLRVGLGTGAEIDVAGLVIATDPYATRELLLSSGVGDPAWRERVGALSTAPPFGVWRGWLDRRVSADRSAFLGTSGFGPLDNITVLERFEEGARRWSAAHDGSVVELHAYALPEPVEPAQVQARLQSELSRIYPELAGFQAREQEWVLAQDCPLASTAPWRDRLTVDSPDPRVVLAGDGIRCDYPVALMERAATTGFLAANRLLASSGLAGHDLWTVPMAGRHKISAPLHRLVVRS